MLLVGRAHSSHRNRGGFDTAGGCFGWVAEWPLKVGRGD